MITCTQQLFKEKCIENTMSQLLLDLCNQYIGVKYKIILNRLTILHISIIVLKYI